MAQQTKTITSESLEAAYRALTPSQDGFTEDLMATNTIVPVLDLTADAQGTSTPQFLQTAWDFSTGFNKHQAASASTIISNTGFWQVDSVVSINDASTADHFYAITDGLTVTKVWQISGGLGSGGEIVLENKFIVFLRAGDSFTVTGANTNFIANTWYRQVATINGTLVNPLGFTPQ